MLSLSFLGFSDFPYAIIIVLMIIFLIFPFVNIAFLLWNTQKPWGFVYKISNFIAENDYAFIVMPFVKFHNRFFNMKNEYVYFSMLTLLVCISVIGMFLRMKLPFMFNNNMSLNYLKFYELRFIFPIVFLGGLFRFFVNFSIFVTERLVFPGSKLEKIIYPGVYKIVGEGLEEISNTDLHNNPSNSSMPSQNNSPKIKPSWKFTGTFFSIGSLATALIGLGFSGYQFFENKKVNLMQYEEARKQIALKEAELAENKRHHLVVENAQNHSFFNRFWNTPSSSASNPEIFSPKKETVELASDYNNNKS